MYVVECLDCEDGNVSLSTVKRVNGWIQEHIINEGNLKHTVSVYDEYGTCLADVENGQHFDGTTATPDFDT